MQPDRTTLARAAGLRAGNANMRKHGRGRWNAQDWNAAVTRFLELMAQPAETVAQALVTRPRVEVNIRRRGKR